MEQIEEGFFLAAAVWIFCLALSCLFREQQMIRKLDETVYRNYHQEAIIEEIWNE